MVNKRYVSGRNYENRCLAKLKREGAVRGGRFYASKGVTDIWWVDKDGVHNEAQCKYSKNKPYLPLKEVVNLRLMAKEIPQIKVWAFLKQRYKKEVRTQYA